MKVKPSKIRWKVIPEGVRAMCFTAGCEALTNQYCKRGDCGEPHCNEHKAEHRIEKHTKPRLLRQAAVPVDTLPLEVLALIAKIRRHPAVTAVGATPQEGGGFVAWATTDSGARLEAHAGRVEDALHDVYVQARPLRSAGRPRRRAV